MAGLPAQLRGLRPVPAGRSWAADLGVAVLLAGVYVAGAKAAFALAVVQTSIAPIWPPSGIALAAVLLLGRRAVPGVALGALVFNASTAVPLWVSAAIALGNTLEALAGAWLLRRAGFSVGLERVRDVLALAGLAAPVSATISASIGVMSLWASGTLPVGSLPSAWVIWWAGDIAGILTVAPPLLLGWTRPWNHRPRVTRVLEAAALAATLALLAMVALAVPAAGTFLVFPALAWAAVRFRQVGAAIAGLFIAAVVVWATARGQGPFAGSSLTQGLLLSQAFAGVLIATGLFLLAALTAERDQATRLLDATFERLPVGLVLLNPDLTLRRGSRNAEQLLGVQLSPGLAARTLVRRLQMTDLAGRPWPAEGTQMLAATRRSDASHGEVAITRYSTGEPVRLEYWGVPVHDNGRLAALALLFHDVTALRRAEADRERLLGRLLRLQQDERRQLAIGLQREVVHGLTATLTRLDGIQERLPDGDDRTRRSLGRAGEALNHSLQATRRLIFGLRPPLLDTQGLVAAINQQLSKVTVETGVQTDLRWRGHERLDGALEATAFRAVQEALANVVQHANASRLLVTGHVADGLLAVEVIDDGTGFTPDTHQQAPGDGHLGMRTMSEWIQLAGGSLQVRSAPAAGTTVSINLPIRPRP